jgi:hypothetical protein
LVTTSARTRAIGACELCGGLPVPIRALNVFELGLPDRRLSLLYREAPLSMSTTTEGAIEVVLRPENPIPAQLRLMQEKARLVAKEPVVCTAVFGSAGIGKTFLTERVLAASGVPYRLTRGSGVGLLMSAYELRDGGVLMMDDCDELVIGGGQTQTNRMKELLAPQTVRTIHNYTKEAAEGKGLLPPVFQVRCGVIWLTNLDIGKLPEKVMNRINSLIDRGLSPINISQEPLDLLNYVEHLVATGEMRLNAGRNSKNGLPDNLSLGETNDVLEYFHMNAWRLQTISVRTLERLARYRRLAPDRWREMADSELRTKPISSGDLPSLPTIQPISTAA